MVEGRQGMAVTRRQVVAGIATSPLASFPQLHRAEAQDRTFRHATTLFESVKYGPDFKQFDYVNADAPKGGRIRLATLGTFDSINPFTIKGDAVSPGVNETLMKTVVVLGWLALRRPKAPQRSLITQSLKLK